MSEEELVTFAAGGIVGGIAGVIGMFLLIFYILTVIASWKIFTKAGEAGWKALIPVYNAWILYKLIGVSFWKWLVLPAIISGVFSSIGNGNSDLKTIMDLLSGIATLVIDIMFARGLAKAFGKGTGFTVGLVLLPNIFQLILAFDSSEYQGPAEEV